MRVLRSACKHSTNTRRRHRRLTPRHMPNRQFRYRSTHSRRIEIRFCQAAIDEAAQECPHGHGRHRKVCRISLQPQSCEMDKQEMERERERARARESRRHGGRDRNTPRLQSPNNARRKTDPSWNTWLYYRMHYQLLLPRGASVVHESPGCYLDG